MRLRLFQRRKFEAAPHTALPASGFSIGIEGWCYLGVMAFVFSGALIRDINLLMLLFGALAGPLAYSVWYSWIALRHVEVRRHLPDRIHAGDSFEVTLEIVNRRRWFGLWAIVVTDRIRRQDHREQRSSRLMFLHLRPGHTYQSKYQVQLIDRGEYEFGPISLSTRFPLGLLHRWQTVGQGQRLIVWPRLGTFGGRLPKAVHTADQNSRQVSNQRGFWEGDFYGLRDWRPGDGQRWIHWRTTARRGELMVRQFERHRAPDVTVLVDLWQPPHARGEDRENVELAVSFAGTLARATCRKGGSHLTMAVAGRDELILRGTASAALLERALNSLATVEASSDDRLPDLLVRTLSLLRGGTKTILVSTRSNTLFESSRFAALRGDARARNWLSQIRWVETGDREFEKFFVVH